jgi:hypothetical protein
MQIRLNVEKSSTGLDELPLLVEADRKEVLAIIALALLGSSSVGLAMTIPQNLMQ